MSNKTINQALEGLYKGLGGDPSALADNSTCSDYIADLESAIKGAASGAQIDDSAPSETKVYSSAKTEELIGSIETLPDVTADDIGKVLSVVSDGEGGATWSEKTPDEPVYIEAVGSGATNIQLSKTTAEIGTLFSSGKQIIIIHRFSANGFPNYRYFTSQLNDSTLQFGSVALVTSTILRYDCLNIAINSGGSTCSYSSKNISISS